MKNKLTDTIFTSIENRLHIESWEFRKIRPIDHYVEWIGSAFYSEINGACQSLRSKSRTAAIALSTLCAIAATGCESSNADTDSTSRLSLQGIDIEMVAPEEPKLVIDRSETTAPGKIVSQVQSKWPKGNGLNTVAVRQHPTGTFSKNPAARKKIKEMMASTARFYTKKRQRLHGKAQLESSNFIEHQGHPAQKFSVKYPLPDGRSGRVNVLHIVDFERDVEIIAEEDGVVGAEEFNGKALEQFRIL